MERVASLRSLFSVGHRRGTATCGGTNSNRPVRASTHANAAPRRTTDPQHERNGAGVGGAPGGGGGQAVQPPRQSSQQRQEDRHQNEGETPATTAKKTTAGTSGAADEGKGRQTNEAGGKFRRTLSQKSTKSWYRKKYLAPTPGGRSVTTIASSLRLLPKTDNVAVATSVLVPVVFQWPQGGTEISVLFRATDSKEWEEYSMYGDSNKGYRLMVLLEPAVYHFKFWVDGVYYQHPGCPLPQNFPDDFVISFNLQVVCKHIQPAHVKKLMLKYAAKTWVRHAKRHGFVLKTSPDAASSRHLRQMTLSFSSPAQSPLQSSPSATVPRSTAPWSSEKPSKERRKTGLARKLSSLRRNSKKSGHEARRSNKDPSSSAYSAPRTSSVTPRPSMCEEEDIDTASTISEGSPREALNDADRDEIDNTADQILRFSDDTDEEQFYSDSSYYSSSEGSEATDSETSDDAERHPLGHDEEDVQKQSRGEKRRQKMKRGPLVRLHPKTFLPVVFSWDGSATSVRLLYKSYFQSKWKSQPMQPSTKGSDSRWTVRISLLPGIYRTCYLVDGERYYSSSSRMITDPQQLLQESNLYRIDVDAKPWLEATEKKGLLVKQGGRIKTWKQRHTVLQGHMLSYYKDVQEARLIDSIQLSQIQGEVELGELPGKDRACFRVRVPGRTYVFTSSKREEIEDWVHCIRRSAFQHKNWERALAHYRPAPASYHNTV